LVDVTEGLDSRTKRAFEFRRIRELWFEPKDFEERLIAGTVRYEALAERVSKCGYIRTPPKQRMCGKRRCGVRKSQGNGHS
jgi:hypothetical protein